MLSITATRNVVGIIGNVVSFGLFFSPSPTFWRIFKKKSTEKFHPYPYLAALMNCMLWVFYGLPWVHPDSTLIMTINGIGVGMELIYLTIFLIYTTPKNRIIIFVFLLGELAVFAIIVLANLLGVHGTKNRTLDVGIICVLFNAAMYASPLSNVVTVIKNKNSEYMPFWLCLVGFVNGLLWFAYGFLKTFDPFLVSGNGFGSVCGLIQLTVYFIYKNGGNKTEDVKPSNVQLTDTV